MAANASINLNPTNTGNAGGGRSLERLRMARLCRSDHERVALNRSSRQNQGGADNGASAHFNNAGTVQKTAGTGTSTIAVQFNNSGTVNVQSGTLSLAGGGTDVGATYQGAGTVNFSGGTRTLDAASSITTNATFSGGQTTVNGGTGTGLLTVTGGLRRSMAR